MNYFDLVAKFIGDTARLFSIVILSTGAVVGMYFKVDTGALTVISLMFAGAVGAKSYENHAEIKAKAAATTSSVDTTTVTPREVSKVVESKTTTAPASAAPPVHMG